MPDSPSDTELRFLRSGQLSLEREVELYKQIAQDNQLQARFASVQPLSAEERRAHLDRLLGRSVPPPVMAPSASAMRRAWSEVVARIQELLPSGPTSGPLQPQFGWRDADLGDEEHEKVFHSQDLDFEGREVNVTASAVLQPGAGGQNRLFLRASVVDPETFSVLPGIVVHIACPALTTGRATTDADGVAEFRLVTGGHWLRDKDAEVTGEFVLSLTR